MPCHIQPLARPNPLDLLITSAGAVPLGENLDGQDMDHRDLLGSPLIGPSAQVDLPTQINTRSYQHSLGEPPQWRTTESYYSKEINVNRATLQPPQYATATSTTHN